MGLFNEIFLYCPKCESFNRLQVKGLYPEVKTYYLHEVPEYVMDEVKRRNPERI